MLTVEGRNDKGTGVGPHHYVLFVLCQLIKVLSDYQKMFCRYSQSIVGKEAIFRVIPAFRGTVVLARILSFNHGWMEGYGKKQPAKVGIFRSSQRAKTWGFKMQLYYV